MERGLRVKTNPIDDFSLPDKLDLEQFKDTKFSDVLEYLSIIYERVPEVRSDIIKALINATLDEALIDAYSKTPN